MIRWWEACRYCMYERRRNDPTNERTWLQQPLPVELVAEEVDGVEAVGHHGHAVDLDVRAVRETVCVWIGGQQAGG